MALPENLINHKYKYYICRSMQKRLLALFLLAVMISANFSRFFAYAGFHANQKYIAENLCINKARPWLHCNGHCYFIKKVKQAAENEKKQGEKDNLKRLEISFFQELSQLCFFAPVVLKSIQSSFPAYSYQYSNHYIDTIFRPPKQLA